MKKKIVAAVLAGVLALTGIVPFIAETFSVRAEEASVIGEWFGNIWGTPAVMTLDKDGAFSIKYDNKDKTELTGKWVQKENQILVNEGTDDDLLIDYDEKKETMTTQSNGADLFGVNNVFLTVDDKKAGLYMDIDSTDGIIDISDLETVFSDGTLSFKIGGGNLGEKKDEYKDIECDATMLEDGTLRMTLSDASEISFIMEKSTRKDMDAAKEQIKGKENK